MDKTWIEVEKEETVTLLRKLIEEYNEMDYSRIDVNDMKIIHMAWDTLCKLKKEI